MNHYHLTRWLLLGHWSGDIEAWIDRYWARRVS